MISVCIITRNERENIAKCLECLKITGFEIIVVDTGSCDGTKQVAEKYTDNIYDFIWCDDFAAAKNFAISKASNPFIMMIDSDEFLEYIEKEALLTELKEHPDMVGRIRRKNVFTRKGLLHENQEWINRIFEKDKYHYEGTIHEQVTAIDGSSYDTYQAPVVIRHTGYDLPFEERKKKAYRNAVLLNKELNRLNLENDEEYKPYILYQLGKSCYMAEHYQEACEYFARGLTYDLDEKLEYVIDMVETYGYALLNSGQPKAALYFNNIYSEFGDSADFQFLMGLIYMNNAKFEQAIEEFLKAVKNKECRNKGVNSYAAYYNIGVIYECLEKKELARKYYEKSGDYEPARKRLEQL